MILINSLLTYGVFIEWESYCMTLNWITQIIIPDGGFCICGLLAEVKGQQLYGQGTFDDTPFRTSSTPRIQSPSPHSGLVAHSA